MNFCDVEIARFTNRPDLQRPTHTQPQNQPLQLQQWPTEVVQQLPVVADSVRAATVVVTAAVATVAVVDVAVDAVARRARRRSGSP